jgi:transposase
MRGTDERTGELFSYVDLEDRVPARHPLRLIRRIVNDVLRALDGEFAKLYADSGRPSIAPERLLRALRSCPWAWCNCASPAGLAG